MGSLSGELLLSFMDRDRTPRNTKLGSRFMDLSANSKIIPKMVSLLPFMLRRDLLLPPPPQPGLVVIWLKDGWLSRVNSFASPC